ncbi:RagB/SusD family nutrient uptake outer membrane protein [Marinilabiliaceae bacterium JC017]|nr:RagB/SusD family nutrient uptake outer membrane protein [Marinilabiliaceae bacterium JC017]
MKIKIYNLLLLGGLFASSCTNLDDQVYSEITGDQYPENQIQAQLITNNAYSQLQNHCDHGWWFAQEITGDLIVAPTRGGDWDDGGKWRKLHQHTWDNNIEAVNDMWRNFYNGVTECNKAIEYLGDSETAKNAVAQMKVLRAYYYYLLIDNYGDVPYITSFSEAPEKPQKETRAKIFENIVIDIKASIDDLDGVSKSSVNKYTAYALLAKLYLNAEVFTGTAQWQEAENYCDKVMEGSYGLESNRLAPFSAENENSSENIFTIPYDEDNYQGFLLHRRSLHYNSTVTFDANTTFWNGFCTQEKLVDLFEDGDQRKSGLLLGKQYSSTGEEILDAGAGNAPLVFTKNVPALKMDASYSAQEIKMSGARMVKFEVEKGVKDHMNNDFPIFRLADFKLMKAECELRKAGGSTTEAKTLINEIRTMAGATPWNDADITLDNLLDERGRELWCEGHRRQDLVRFDKFKDGWWEKAPDSEANYIFPIPQWAIDSNPNLK